MRNFKIQMTPNWKKPCSEHTVCKYTFQIFYPPSAGLPQGKVSSVCDPGQSGNWGYASEPVRASVHTPKSRPFILAPHLLAQREEKHPSAANKNREKMPFPGNRTTAEFLAQISNRCKKSPRWNFDKNST